MDFNKIKDGSIGISKAILGIDKAEENLIENRRKICKTCRFKLSRKYLNRDVDTCGVCGCLIVAKTKLRNSKCPKRFW